LLFILIGVRRQHLTLKTIIPDFYTKSSISRIRATGVEFNVTILETDLYVNGKVIGKVIGDWKSYRPHGPKGSDRAADYGQETVLSPFPGSPPVDGGDVVS
jgi:hypothetical protein